MSSHATLRRFSLLALGLLLSAVVMVLHPACARAQAAEEQALREVEAALAQGSERALLAHAASRIEIALFGANMLYSGAQAQYVMQSFFRDFPPRRFSFEEVTRADKSWFAKGTYWTSQAEQPLRIHVHLRRQPDGWKVRSIRIEQRK